MLWHFVPYRYSSQQQAWFYFNGITVSHSNYCFYFHLFKVAVLMNITGWHTRLFFPQRLHYCHAILTWFPLIFYDTRLLSLCMWCYTLPSERLAFLVRKTCPNTVKKHSEVHNIIEETSSGSITTPHISCNSKEQWHTSTILSLDVYRDISVLKSWTNYYSSGTELQKASIPHGRGCKVHTS